MKGTLNLLPPALLADQARGRRNLRLIKLGAVGLALSVALVAIVQATAATTGEQVTLLTNKVETLRENLEPYADVRSDALFIGDRLEALESLTKADRRWYQPLLTLGSQTPPDVQIVAFVPKEQKSGLGFTLQGVASSRTTIVSFKTALEETAEFTALILESSELVGDATTASEQVTFTLSGTIIIDGTAASGDQP